MMESELKKGLCVELKDTSGWVTAQIVVIPYDGYALVKVCCEHCGMSYTQVARAKDLRQLRQRSDNVYARQRRA